MLDLVATGKLMRQWRQVSLRVVHCVRALASNGWFPPIIAGVVWVCTRWDVQQQAVDLQMAALPQHGRL